jgi:hypothetical protein
VRDEDLKALCEKDNESLQSDIEQLSSGGKICFAFDPRCEIISWHNKREDLNAQLLHGRWETRFRGAVAESGKAWIMWHFDEVEKKLKVQRIVVLEKHEQDRNVQEIASLLRFAQWVAKASDISAMLIWNPDEVTISASQMLMCKFNQTKMRIEDRECSIPAARRRYDEAQDNIVWEANEYYAWC